MGEYKCPQCGNQVQAASHYGLVCPRCNYGAQPAATAPMFAAGPVPFGTPPPMQAPPAMHSRVPSRGVMQGSGPVCPRCASTYTKKGGIATWAIIVAIVGFFVVCVLSLLFLLAKDESECFNCGLRWK